MKRITFALCALLAFAPCALADGYGYGYNNGGYGGGYGYSTNNYGSNYNYYRDTFAMNANTDWDGYFNSDGFGGLTAADEMSVTVISRNASVWSEPRTNSKKLGSVSHGKSLMLVSNGYYDEDDFEMENGFYHVEYDGDDGWINSDYVIRNTLEIVLMEGNVPAYIAPDRTSKKVGSLNKLTRYRVVGFCNDFYIVLLRDAAVAYIPTDVKHYDTSFEAEMRQSFNYRGRTTKKTALRCGPGTQYAEIETVKSGYEFRYSRQINGWYVISYSSKNTDGAVFAYIDPNCVTAN